MKTNSIKIFAQRKEILFAREVVIDGYKFPDGEYRASITGASTLVGFSKEWLSRVHIRAGKTLRELRSEGYDGSHQEVWVERSQGGSTSLKTLSLDDLWVIINYAADRKKIEAKALRRALGRVSLEDYFRKHFQDPILSLEEQRALFYKEYAKTIDWHKEDSIDIEQSWTFAEDRFTDYANWSSSSDLESMIW